VALTVLDALLEPNCLLSNCQSIRLYPGETRQPWHTDDGFYLAPRPRPLPFGVSTIWAIDRFTADNGATEVVVGSHRWGEDHPDDRPDAPFERAEMAPGSVLFFDAALWHRGGANQSNGTRLCVTNQYCQPWLRPQESQLLIAPPTVARRFSPRVRSMVGYSIHPPFIGQVEGKHPARLVDEESYRAERGDDSAIAEQILQRPPSTFP
jgi:ectoine hydroxylase-related dioxygenase (phytanoyl-CoA dioxygenase family)